MPCEMDPAVPKPPRELYPADTDKKDTTVTIDDVAAGRSSSQQSPAADTPGSSRPDPHNLKPQRRSCDSCRRLKVKCLRDPYNAQRPCKRCLNTAKTCIVSARTRKSDDIDESRLSELEKGIVALYEGLAARERQSFFLLS
ncbi:hypothetical protein GGS20DRAFT_565195 [Poronia punctata]|nr:hypothetical protein GGS20DRAFT_565195 [Poronia punctata]